MKRIFYFLMAAFMIMNVAANAQTIKNDGVFSHMYIGLNCGANQKTVSDYSNWNNGFKEGLKSLTYNAGIELGKDVTPITGFSLQGVVSPIYHNVTNGSGEWKMNRSDVFGNIKFNLMNLFGGYKGYPRRVEIRTVTGIGWNHDFEIPKNDLALQAGLEFDFNLGKNRSWYITFTPMVQANEILKGEEIQYLWTGGPNKDKAADLKANIGVAYRFGRGNKSHNFTICPYTYTDEQYAELYNMYDECMNRPTETTTDTIIVEKIVETVVEKVIEKPANTFIDFEIGTSKLNPTAQRTIDFFVGQAENFKDEKIKVIGSADSKTGTKKLNERLANERANVVASELVKEGFKNVVTEVVIDVDEVAESSRCAIIVME
jgi:outer membrane protein OmpA-like peptidoglycan-associated protein